jgi:hypothetical protein
LFALPVSSSTPTCEFLKSFIADMYMRRLGGQFLTVNAQQIGLTLFGALYTWYLYFAIIFHSKLFLHEEDFIVLRWLHQYYDQELC